METPTTRGAALQAIKGRSVFQESDERLLGYLAGIAAFDGQGPLYEKQDALIAQTIVQILNSRDASRAHRDNRRLAIAALVISIVSVAAQVIWR